MKLNIGVLLAIVCVFIRFANAEETGKNSGQLTEVDDQNAEKSIFRNLVRPFRMEKLNLIWIKAQHRLTEPKLQSLYTQLKIQDKEEIQYKQNAKETDADGSLAAKLREKLIAIMRNYNLMEYEEEHDQNKYAKNEKYDKYQKDKSDQYKNKVGTFKDKKLNKLWNKAEVAGFTVDELNELKKEFAHYDEKVEMYYKMLNSLDETIKKRYESSANTVNEDELDLFNEVVPDEEVKDTHKTYEENANNLKETHRDLKETYDALEAKTSKGKNRREFVEPKVLNLWNAAIESNFTAQELNSLKEELFHFESKLLKLSHLYAEHAVSNDKNKGKKDKKATEKLENMEKNIKKQQRKVEKLQESIEQQIYRHTEL